MLECVHWIWGKYWCTSSIMITLKKHVKNSRLLFSDTDSLMSKIETKDVYEDFSNDKEMFHFSN